MKIIVDVSEREFKRIVQNVQSGSSNSSDLLLANGTKICKGSCLCEHCKDQNSCDILNGAMV